MAGNGNGDVNMGGLAATSPAPSAPTPSAQVVGPQGPPRGYPLVDPTWLANAMASMNSPQPQAVPAGEASPAAAWVSPGGLSVRSPFPNVTGPWYNAHVSLVAKPNCVGEISEGYLQTWKAVDILFGRSREVVENMQWCQDNGMKFYQRDLFCLPELVGNSSMEGVVFVISNLYPPSEWREKLKNHNIQGFGGYANLVAQFLLGLIPSAMVIFIYRAGDMVHGGIGKAAASFQRASLSAPLRPLPFEWKPVASNHVEPQEQVLMGVDSPLRVLAIVGSTQGMQSAVSQQMEQFDLTAILRQAQVEGLPVWFLGERTGRLPKLCAHFLMSLSQTAPTPSRTQLVTPADLRRYWGREAQPYSLKEYYDFAQGDRPGGTYGLNAALLWSQAERHVGPVVRAPTADTRQA